MITLQLTIPENVIKDIFITATEGACSEWMGFDPEIKWLLKDTEGSCFSEKVFNYVIKEKKTLFIFDLDTYTSEDGAQSIGKLSFDTIQSGLQKMLNDPQERDSLLSELQDQGNDAHTTDYIMQYIVLGEVVYG